VRIVDPRNFPVSRQIAAALVIVKPGGMRELHWHPNGSEWQFYIAGKARMTVFSSIDNARTAPTMSGMFPPMPDTTSRTQVTRTSFSSKPLRQVSSWMFR
jgi:oxalate decarboxylase